MRRFLHEEIGRIVAAWAQQVRIEIPAAKELTDEIIIKGVNDFLRALGEMISSPRSSPGAGNAAGENLVHSRVHGLTRAKIPGYTLDQVIAEYRILRSMLFSVLEKAGPLPPEDRDRLLEAIDDGMTTAATEFALSRGFADARLSNALAEKNDAVAELTGATARIEELGIEREARENFVSALSHDLRNPLGAAKLGAQMIVRDPGISSSAKRNAIRIAANIDRADRMIRDLLDSARIRAGEPLPLHKDRYDLTEIVRSTLVDLSYTFGERFVLDASGPVRGEVDADGVRRIVENLATNAVKYGAPDAPIRFVVTETDREIRLRVHNEGNPISKADQKTLFKQFRRTESAHAGKEKGWGIGLTLVRGIAEAHGGKIAVQSGSGEGTTFTLTFPKALFGLWTEHGPATDRDDQKSTGG